MTKIYESNSNFFIPAIKLWQTYTSLFGASNEIGKAWMNMIVGWTRRTRDLIQYYSQSKFDINI